MAGGLLARRTGVPWVADWRDPWLANPDVDAGPRLGAGEAGRLGRLARLVAPRMAGAACVNDAIADEVRALAPGVPVEVIPNGAEVERIALLERHPDPRLTFLFTGYFFGDRGPGVFLDALAAALRERPQLRDGVRATVHRLVPRRRARPAAGARPGRHGRESSRRSRTTPCCRPSATPTCCCCSCRTGPGAEAVVPAKAWEYLAADRPVLALVPPHGAAARELQAAAAGEVCAPDDTDGVRRAILRLADRHAAGTLAVPGLSPAARAAISRRGRAAQLARLMRRAAG